MVVFIDQRGIFRGIFRSRLFEAEVRWDEGRDADGEYIADHRDKILYVDMVTQKQRTDVRPDHAAESIKSGDVIIRFRPVSRRVYIISFAALAGTDQSVSKR